MSTCNKRVSALPFIIGNKWALPAWLYQIIRLLQRLLQQAEQVLHSLLSYFSLFLRWKHGAIHSPFPYRRTFLYLPQPLLSVFLLLLCFQPCSNLPVLSIHPSSKQSFAISRTHGCALRSRYHSYAINLLLSVLEIASAIHAISCMLSVVSYKWLCLVIQ